jgi:dephospho-CoA kinase
MVKRRKVVAITGSIGSGKSLVGEILAKRGHLVIDTDVVVHELLDTDKQVQKAIADRFGKDVLHKENGIDRAKLGNIVFSDEIARRDLERIVHPATLNRCDRILDTLPIDQPVFVLIPLLFEAGLAQRYDEIWSVTANEDILRERLKKRSNLTNEEITKRLAAQLPQSEKARRSHRVINNSGPISETERQIDAILVMLEEHGINRPR